MFLNLNTSMKDKIMSYAIYLQSFFEGPVKKTFFVQLWFQFYL